MIYQDGLLLDGMNDTSACAAVRHAASCPEPSTFFILGAALILAYLAHRWVRHVS